MRNEETLAEEEPATEETPADTPLTPEELADPANQEHGDGDPDASPPAEELPDDEQPLSHDDLVAAAAKLGVHVPSDWSDEQITEVLDSIGDAAEAVPEPAWVPGSPRG